MCLLTTAAIWRVGACPSVCTVPPRDPEQYRVAAGSTVLLGLMEVLKAHTDQAEVVDTMRCCLSLMLQLMVQSGAAQRAAGVLLPVCTCVEVLGLGMDRESTKRLLGLCLKAATTNKEPWQVRLTGNDMR